MTKARTRQVGTHISNCSNATVNIHENIITMWEHEARAIVPEKKFRDSYFSGLSNALTFVLKYGFSNGTFTIPLLLNAWDNNAEARALIPSRNTVLCIVSNINNSSFRYVRVTNVGKIDGYRLYALEDKACH